MFETFDSFAPPQLQKKVSQSGWSEVDLDQVKQKLATVIAEAKANDPKELKAEITRLKQELAKKIPAAPAPAPAKERIVEVPIIKTEDLKLLRDVVADMGDLASGLDGCVDSIKAAVQRYSQLPARRSVATAPSGARAVVAHARPLPAPRAAAVAESNGDLSRPQLKLIEAMGEAEAIGRSEISRSWLAFIAGVSPLSSGFEKNVSTLSAKGMIRYPSPGRVALTEHGRVLVPSITQPLTTESLLDRVCRLLSGPQAHLLRILHSEYPNSLTRSELASHADVSELSSGFEKNVSTLSGRELVSYPSKGEVQCAEWLFRDSEAVA